MSNLNLNAKPFKFTQNSLQSNIYRTWSQTIILSPCESNYLLFETISTCKTMVVLKWPSYLSDGNLYMCPIFQYIFCFEIDIGCSTLFNRHYLQHDHMITHAVANRESHYIITTYSIKWWSNFFLLSKIQKYCLAFRLQKL